MADGSPTEWLEAPAWDQQWNETSNAQFYRRLPLVLDSILRARTLAAVTASIIHGGEYLWPDDELRLDALDASSLAGAGLTDDEQPHVSQHGENADLRRRTTMRRAGDGIDVVVSLVAHGARLGDLVLTRHGSDPWVTRQEREYLRAYAEMCSAALYSSMALAELRRLALTDPLTGLPNRRALDRELDRIDAQGGRLGLIFADIDGLGSVNNTLGYDAGNILIRALADTLAETTDTGVFAARLGGDEFVVIVHESTRTATTAAAITRAFARRQVAPDIAARSGGVSLGTALQGPGESTRDVMRRGAGQMRSEKAQRKAARMAASTHP
jgi:diguanylate cyclase (GGDEF)-like protein